MQKVDPKELKSFATAIDWAMDTHKGVLNAEPELKKAAESTRDLAQAKYDRIAEVSPDPPSDPNGPHNCGAAIGG